MDAIFDELCKLPCGYCKYANCYASHCLKRQTTIHSELYVCEEMVPNMEILGPAILNYFDFRNNMK